jgi:hypothetical protein
MEQLWNVVHAVHHNILAAVIIEVADGATSAGYHFQNARAGFERDILKFPIS